MKELSQHIKENVAVIKEIPAKKQFAHLGTLLPQPGQKVYELNLTTGEFIEAELEKTVSIKGVKKIKAKEDCIYTLAINRKNAERKFIKMVYQLIK